MNVHLLRGRVIVRPVPHEHGQHLIHIPATSKIDDPREDTERAKRGGRSLGRGVIVAMGPPAMTRKRGAEVLPAFAVGDEVFFLGQHVSRDVDWDGVACKAVAQEEIAIVLDK